MVFNPRWPPNLRGSARWRIFCPTCRKKRKAHTSKAASLRRIKFTFVHFCRNEIPCFRVGYLRGAHKRGSAVVDRQYLVRQALTLLKFGKATSDPNVAAGLIEKAADLKSQVDETSAPLDLSPLAPDIEPPPAT